ncbi:MAG TPA: SCP2 sterol-binding domain-containing protein [Anaerolineae bacterium]|nr:SCP2 sterol-binding domain-containing protein [Anaerolineae bacterium]
MTTLAEMIQKMPSAFVPEKAEGVNAKVQFDFTGDDGGQYVVNIHDGVCEVSAGAAPDARTTVIVGAADYQDMIEGRLDPMKAFMGGKLKVKGDMMFMMKFQQMFDPKRAQT